MAVAMGDGDSPVACLIFRHSKHPDRTAPYRIYGNDEFDIGREEVQKAWGLGEPTISTHHLRFRCVVYEDDDEQKVAPMIYVRVLSSNQVRLIRTGIDKGTASHVLSKLDPDVLLNDGDVLYLTPDIFIVFQADLRYSAIPVDVDDVRKAELQSFCNQFNVSDRRLGVGGNASVFVAVKQLAKRQVACKIVPQPQRKRERVQDIQSDVRLNPQQKDAELRMVEQRVLRKREDLAREYNILRDISHPNIITLEKVICCTYNIYIFQELITGGDLLSYIDQKGALHEAQAAVIARQILTAVEYLHTNGIVHRDIKPENILMTSWRDGARVVLTDFGQSRTIEDAKAAAKHSAIARMQTVVGTYGYTAPEVLKMAKRELRHQGYSKAIDIWSIGCITAILLTGEQIFSGQEDEHELKNPDHVTQDPNRWDLSIMDKGTVWTNIGRKAKSFIRGCLVLDESQRLTAKHALLHPWFTNRHYAADIEAAYQRAIQDWKPRNETSSLFEYIDTADVVPDKTRLEQVNQSVNDVKSRHFHDVPPMGFSLFRNSAGALQQKHARTPLPGISEEESDATVDGPMARKERNDSFMEL